MTDRSTSYLRGPYEGVWPTGDAILSGTVTYRLTVPKSQRDWVLHVLVGLLNQGEKVANWVEAGETTPEEAAQTFEGIINSMMVLDIIGQVCPFLRDTAPIGWHLCDGHQVPEGQAPEAWSLWPASLKLLDPNVMLVPDLRGRTVIGAGQGSGLSNRVRYNTTGAESVALSTAQMPVHVHAYTAVVGLPGAGIIQAGAGIGAQPLSTGSAGLGQAHNNMQPSYALDYYVYMGLPA